MPMKCPICRKEVEPGAPFYPFCSDRCRIIDLGNWAAEKYRIPTPPRQDEQGPEDERKPDERK